MEHQEENEAIVEPDEDGGWVDTHHHVDPSGDQATAGAQESFSEMTLDSDKVRIDSHVNLAIVEPDEDGGCRSCRSKWSSGYCGYAGVIVKNDFKF